MQHQCTTLISTVPALKVASENFQLALRRGDAVELGYGERTDAANQLAGAKLRKVRAQVAEMLRWLARLRGLFLAFDAMVRDHVQLEDMRLIEPRFLGLHSVTNLLVALTDTLCSSEGRHRSALLDSLIQNLNFHNELDRHAYPDVATKFLNHRGLVKSPNFLAAKALYVVKQGQSIFDYVRWFGFGAERKRLSVKFEQLHRMTGFDVDTIDELQEQIQALERRLAPEAAFTDEQLSMFQARMTGLHSADLLSSELFHGIEDTCADAIELASSVRGGVLTVDMAATNGL